ncbi:hypothetical protein [Planobispora longispora]|uniref:Uncharacterized protein n=1 Tax=Planobispora longispora TaxID=28887 RepID=A0A8J3RRK4_9ACTN|nr:hypothetical protein [Planobispora longispora]GIH78582.1 hypothetical protein Plo01_50110 [Planobispora longispora]
MLITMSVPELAQVLFASALQASDDPSPEQARTAIEDRLRICHADLADCLASVAQEAGDHPEAYASRMRWALGMADRVSTAVRPGRMGSVTRTERAGSVCLALV